MTRRLSQVLDPQLITLNVRSTQRSDALSEVARLLEGHSDVVDFDGLYRDLLARERLDTTWLGNGIALPHARTEHVRKIVMAVGRSTSGVFFENGHETVRLMFVFGSPESDPGGYLQLVGLLCRIIKDPAHREALLNASTPEAFVRQVLDLEAKVLGVASAA